MQFLTGVTDQPLPFEALDVDDNNTPLSGLSSWVVYRTRNGAAAVLWDSPTIVERRPGLYWLLLDEDMTLDPGDDFQAVAIEISHAGMRTVRTGFELVRPKITVGETLNNAHIDAAISTRSVLTQQQVVDGMRLDGAGAPESDSIYAMITNAIGPAQAAAGSAASAAVSAASADGKLPADTTTKLNRLDVTLSTRLATSGYTVPPTTAAIRSELDLTSTKLANLDVVLSTRMAQSSYTAPLDAAGVASAIRLDGTGTIQANSLYQQVLNALGAASTAAGSAGAADAQTQAAALRAAIGLTSANLNTQLTTLTSQTLATAIRAALGFASNDADAQLAAIAAAIPDNTALQSAINTATPGSQFYDNQPGVISADPTNWGDVQAAVALINQLVDAINLKLNVNFSNFVASNPDNKTIADLTTPKNLTINVVQP